MDKKEMISMMTSLKSKLMATVSMLLVSAILLTNVSYAWFVLSTAPEVAGVPTTSGANGALEIALQSSDPNSASGERAEIRSAVGDSSSLSSQPITEANKTWGNIVDISEGYGLEDITLYPARLNLDASNNYKVNPLSYLSVPKYGSDGRVTELVDTEKASYVETDGTGAFEDSGGYGVNVHGFLNDMDSTGTQTIVSYFSRETVRVEAIEKVESYRETLRKKVIEDTVEDNSVGLFKIMIKLTTDWYADMYPWDAADEATIQRIIASLTDIAKESEDALRWALLAYAIADTEHYTPDDVTEMAALGEIYKRFKSLPITSDDGNLSVKSIAVANGYTAIEKAVDALLIVQTRVQEANDAESTAAAGLSLIDVSNTYVMQGVTPPSSQNAVLAHNGIPYDVLNSVTTDYMYMVNSTQDSGNLFSMMAYIIGDYQADILTYMSSTGEIIGTAEDGYVQCTLHLRATSGAGKAAIDSYSPETNVGTLQVVLDSAAKKAVGQIPMAVTRSDVTAYGYSVDLAFRSSEDGSLVLQQEATSRVTNGYEDPNNLNANLQGGGSTMTFEIFGNMTAEQVVELLSSLYVVFMDTSTGEMYAVATAGEVTVDLESVTTTLVLHGIDRDAMEKTGSIQLEEDVIEDNVITTLRADEAKYITAVVFLNGDKVTSGSVSAQGQMSLIGSINLQFALDGVELRAMRYDDYYVAPTDAESEGG